MTEKMALQEKTGNQTVSVKTWRAFLKQILLTGMLSFVVSNSFALPSNFEVETLVSNLSQPVYLAELSDGRMLVGT